MKKHNFADVKEKFVPQRDDKEQKLKKDTIGLVALDEFQRIKSSIENPDKLNSNGTRKINKTDKAKKEAKRKAQASKLSFAVEEVFTKKKSKLSRDPLVDTSFLPDADQELREEEERERLRVEWLNQQEMFKDKTVTIPYLFWNGSGHMHEITCKYGDTIEHFLHLVKEQAPQDKLLFDGLLEGDAKNWKLEDRPKVVDVAWYESHNKELPASGWQTFNSSKHFNK
ncbi:XAP5 protein domain-containing protein [Rozella allomycis CSF55]|uniref:XAP5 protein domain-containing protein n=1 Tax=Rozella allomycis (strain CSF55) TaxID=988480 RepID=A0A075AS01_ROZAC|nr:XAP5 protein domain-containing protein [Rozella allomycis CSF55]|eukprot:EPZ31491.1 XAP5 protein domain-containing protein [Rozella allomycis CSF55]